MTQLYTLCFVPTIRRVLKHIWPKIGLWAPKPAMGDSMPNTLPRHLSLYVGGWVVLIPWTCHVVGGMNDKSKVDLLLRHTFYFPFWAQFPTSNLSRGWPSFSWCGNTLVRVNPTPDLSDLLTSPTLRPVLSSWLLSTVMLTHLGSGWRPSKAGLPGRPMNYGSRNHL